MQYLGKCHSNTCEVWFRAKEPGKYGLNIGHGAYEIFALSGLRRCFSATAAQCRTRDDLALPAHAVAAGRLQLPPSADLLGLRRRGDRALRTVGRRMDDPGAAVALPALGHFRNRQRAADETAGRAMVSAVAVWTMARGQRAVEFSLKHTLAQLSSARKPEETRGRLEIGRRTRLPRTRWFGLRGFGRWCRWRRVSAL